MNPSRAELLGLASRAEAASGPDRILDRDIEIAIQNLHGRGHDDPRDDITARKVLISHGAFDLNYEVVAFSGISLRTPLGTSASLDSAMTLVPEEWAIDCLKEGEVGSWYVNVRPRSWVSEWQFSNAATPSLALVAAALRAQAGETEA